MKFFLLVLVAVLSGCEVTIPEWNNTIGAGATHSVRLGPDGELVCWGSNEEGQCDKVAEPLEQISAGFGYNCGIEADGVLVCWGDNDGFAPAQYGFGVVDGSYVQLSAGGMHACGLLTDGGSTAGAGPRNRSRSLPAPISRLLQGAFIPAV